MPAEDTGLALQLRYKLRDYCSGWDRALPLGGDGGGGECANGRNIGQLLPSAKLPKVWGPAARAVPWLLQALTSWAHGGLFPKGSAILFRRHVLWQSVSSRWSKKLSLGHVAGEIFGDAGLSLFVASIKFGDVGASLFVAGAIFGDDGASLLVSRNIWWCCGVIFRGRGNIW